MIGTFYSQRKKHDGEDVVNVERLDLTCVSSVFTLGSELRLGEDVKRERRAGEDL